MDKHYGWQEGRSSQGQGRPQNGQRWNERYRDDDRDMRGTRGGEYGGGGDRDDRRVVSGGDLDREGREAALMLPDLLAVEIDVSAIINGAEAQETHVSDASGGLAEARILRPGAAPVVAVPPHHGELVFGFVLEGSARLEHDGDHALGPADSFVIPPGHAWRLDHASHDFRLLHVTTGTIPEK